jgi:hypothetical protein
LICASVTEASNAARQLCAPGLSTTDTGKQQVERIPSRHSDHVAALEGDRWDDNGRKRRQDALSVQNRC